MTPSDAAGDALDVALRVARAIEKLGGAYFVGGRLASSLQGEPRATNDIDIVLELPLGRVAQLVDLFAVGPSPYDEVEFARRRPVVVRPSGETLVVKSPEDTVLRKPLWHQQGGSVSERQWRDVVEVLRVSGAQMEFDYLAGWAERLGITAPLERARAESANRARLGLE